MNLQKDRYAWQIALQMLGEVFFLNLKHVPHNEYWKVSSCSLSSFLGMLGPSSCFVKTFQFCYSVVEHHTALLQTFVSCTNLRSSEEQIRSEHENGHVLCASDPLFSLRFTPVSVSTLSNLACLALWFKNNRFKKNYAYSLKFNYVFNAKKQKLFNYLRYRILATMSK